MGNCLVTKLKEVVDNNNLRGIGEVQVMFNSNRTGTVYVQTRSSCVLKILTPGVTFTNGEWNGKTEQPINNSNVRIATVSGACTVSISNKYDLLRLEDDNYSMYMDISDLEAANSLKKIKIIGLASPLLVATGDIKSLKNASEITDVYITANGVTGDLKDLFTSSDCTSIILGTLGGNPTYTKVSGDIVNLTKVPNIKTIGFARLGGIYGDISVFNGAFAALEEANFSQNTRLTGNISSMANHAYLNTLEMADTQVTGTLGDLLVGTPALKLVNLPKNVEWTDADAAIADARIQANGGTITSTGHYFAGGTRVESYS